jgi:CheY-like chemotaxis protein
MAKSRVLIVDDDQLSRRLVAAKITLLGGEVREATDGLEAFALLRAEAADLLILDLEMPRANGYDLLGCIRATPAWKHLPVVVLTGRDDRASLERALAAGATSFLVKPLNWIAFGEHIKHLLAVASMIRNGTAAAGTRSA